MSETLPESHQLVIRGIEAVESTKGQLSAVEKSIDGMEATVRSSAEVARRAGDALERIAKAEEERNRLAAEGTKQRADLFGRIWASQPVQLLILLAICGLAQLVGGVFLGEHLSHLDGRLAVVPQQLGIGRAAHDAGAIGVDHVGLFLELFVGCLLAFL